MLRINEPDARLRAPLAGDGLFVTDELLGGYFGSVFSLFEGLAATFEANGNTLYPVSS